MESACSTSLRKTQTEETSRYSISRLEMSLWKVYSKTFQCKGNKETGIRTCRVLIDLLALQFVLVNPGAEVMKKMSKSKLIETIGQDWIFLTVGEAVGACKYMLHSYKPKSDIDSV